MTARLRALDYRSPAPDYECADGRVVQTRYYDAEGWAKYSAWEQEPGNAALFLAAVQYVVPELDATYIDQRLSIEDCQRLIVIGKGNTECLRAEIKNGSGGGVSQALPPTLVSSPTT